MKKVFLSLLAVVSTVLAVNAKSTNDVPTVSSTSPLAKSLSAPLIKGICKKDAIGALVNPNGFPTAVVVEYRGEIVCVEQRLMGYEDIEVSCFLNGFKAGTGAVQIWAVNKNAVTMWDMEKKHFVEVSAKVARLPRIPYDCGLPSSLKGGDPSVCSFAIAGHFFTNAPDTIGVVPFYSGSANIGSDQILNQFADSLSSVMSVVSKYTTAATSTLGPISFGYDSLTPYGSGNGYKDRLAAFDGGAGMITFYPGANSVYWTNTVFIANATITSVALVCTDKEFKFFRMNNAIATISGKIDTTSAMNSLWVKNIVPETRTKTTNLANPIVYDSLNLSTYMNASGPVVTYYCQLDISIGATLFGTTNTENCTENTSGVNEFDKDVSLEIYPNPIPLGGSATVKSSIKKGNIAIMDGQGRLVGNQKITEEVNTIKHGSLSSGIYFICLYDEDGVPQVSRKVLWE